MELADQIIDEQLSDDDEDLIDQWEQGSFSDMASEGGNNGAQ